MLARAGAGVMRGCELCGSPERESIYSQRFATFDDRALFDGYHVVACAACSFVYADNIPSQAEFDRYYGATSTETAKYATGDKSDELAPWAIENYRAIVAGIAARIPNRATRILDVGSASGHLLAAFRDAGYANVTGFDPSPRSAEIAAARYGIRVVTTPISNMRFDRERFDLILLAGVLEHLRDLPVALGELLPLVAVGGAIWFEVPDASRFADFAAGNAPFQQFSLEHINFFTPVSLRALLARAGWRQRDGWTRIGKVGAVEDPGIDAIFERSVAAPAIALDQTGATAVRSYVAQSTAFEERLVQSIAPLVAHNTPVALWGTGTLTLHLLRNARFARLNVTAFVDRNPQFHGKTIGGIPVLAPAALHGRPETIAIVSRSYEREITASIRDRFALTNPVWELFERAGVPV